LDDDIKLMLEVKAGNRESFNRLVDKYSRQIINYIYRFSGSRQDAEDLAQEVFMKVYNAASAYVPSAKFTTWIYRIASNVSIDYLRRKKHGATTDSLDERLENEDGSAEKQVADDKQASPEKEAVGRETADNINRALASLPENQRAAIILKIYEERSYADIASVLGVSVASVESLIFRARQALQIKLKSL
jgi:RNA polymerase sigma-70 factor (ECF subfamily)